MLVRTEKEYMKRRDFNFGSLSLAILSGLAAPIKSQARTLGNNLLQEHADSMHNTVPAGPPQLVGMIIYPQMTALDLIGPQTFLSALGNIKVSLVWKDKQPVITDSGLQLTPDQSFSECARNLDILFIGGGSKGTLALMKDAETLDFLADRGSRARFVTSVCTGSLVLGAAGLLRGYKATSHWAMRDVLAQLGAELTPGRVVQDRNRITAGGVTAGIDFGLALATQLRDQHYAEMLQLAFEYDPQPPFQAGNPISAPAAVTTHLRAAYAPLLTQMNEAAASARKRWPA